MILGGVYPVSVLVGAARVSDAVLVATAANAISAPVYFGVAAVVFRLAHQIADEIDRAHAAEREQIRRSADLLERERLFQHLHRQVLAVLDRIAAVATPDAELRARSRSQAMVCRQLLTGSHEESAAAGLRQRLSALAARLTARGWRLELVDQELEGEPSEEVGAVLCAALDELLVEPAEEDEVLVVADSRDATTVRLTVRLPRRTAGYGAAVRRVRTRLAQRGGSVREEPRLPTDVRLVIEVPR
jgi:hypothetical protein